MVRVSTRLRRSGEIGRADWIRDRLGGWGRVDSLVPGGFPAYIRVLHPAEGPEERPVRWAEVAERAGVAMVGSIGFADIAAAVHPEGRDVDEPENGNLHPESLAALCEVLARHTATPHTCWFGVWDGNHWLHPAVVTTVFSEDIRDTGRPVPPAFDPTLSWTDPSPALALVELPGREYRLLTGPLDAAREVGRYYGDVFDPLPPTSSGLTTTPGASPPTSTSTAPTSLRPEPPPPTSSPTPDSRHWPPGQTNPVS